MPISSRCVRGSQEKTGAKDGRGQPSIAQIIKAITGSQKRTNAIHYCAKGIIAEVGSKTPVQLIPLDIPRICKTFERYGVATRYNYHSYLRTILRKLAESYGAPHGLHREVPQVQAPSPRTRTVTDAEVEMMLFSASPAMRLFVLLCLDMGLRSGTAVRISPSHYDPDSGTISFTTKKQATQTIAVTEEVAAILATCQRCPPATPFYAFLSVRKGGCRTSVSLSFKHLLRRCGLDDRIRPHDLRRTAAERVYTVTKDMRDVQSLLGHKRLANTMHYLERGGRLLSRSVLEQAKRINQPTELIQ